MNDERMRWHAILDRLPDDKCKVLEVGCWKGTLSIELLRRHEHLELYMIDRWQQYSPTEAKREGFTQFSEMPKGKFITAKKKCLQNIEPHRKRVKVLEMDSGKAAKKFRRHTCDLIFLDGGHSYRQVKKDIRAWLPKVKRGGWICGHDYKDSRPGVVQAVNESFGKKNIITDADSTWFIKVK